MKMGRYHENTGGVQYIGFPYKFNDFINDLLQIYRGIP